MTGMAAARSDDELLAEVEVLAREHHAQAERWRRGEPAPRLAERTPGVNAATAEIEDEAEEGNGP